MMGYGYGSMMVGWGLFGAITWLVVVVDLILVGVWLWQNISKNKTSVIRGVEAKGSYKATLKVIGRV